MTEFTLNEKEQATYEEFRRKHCGSISLKFKPTPVGVAVIVQCEGCGIEQDITDYESW